MELTGRYRLTGRIFVFFGEGLGILMAGVNGDSDVSDGFHGPALLNNFALLAVCISDG
jgi:hypothetical protein